MKEVVHSGWFLLIASTLLASCYRPAQNPQAVRHSAGNFSATTDWADQRRQGIDFVAVGGSPVNRGSAGASLTNWRLEIDFAKQMRLVTLDGTDLRTPVPKPQYSHRGAGAVLDARSAPLSASASRRGISRTRNGAGQNRLLVVIEPVYWRDPLTKRDYAYTVRVEANGKPYVGGGVFIKAGDRLNGTWTLETFKGQRLRPGQFGDKTLPFLEIDPGKGKLTGSTGSSKIRGNVQANGDHLSLDPKAGPRPSSPGSFEASFLESLRQSSLFRIGKDRLTLLVNGQYVMTLRKE